MPTTYMGMTIPTVLVTAGSTYATQINAAFDLVDAHDHTSGKGTTVKAAGLGIDGNVSWGGYSITALKATTFTQQSAVATANSVYFKTDNNLWCTNGSGTAIQLTDASGLNVSALIRDYWATLAVATNYTIGAAASYTHFLTNTAAPRAFTLPAANGVTAGRFYIISDITGTAASNNITINRAGADTFDGGGTSYVIDSNYGYAIVVSDGSSKWTLVNPRAATATTRGQILLDGDLGGTASAPTVVSLTGELTGGTVKVSIASGTDTLQFHRDTSAPVITIADGTTAGTSLTIRGQAAGGSNQAGGPVNITAGAATGTGAPGEVSIASSASTQFRVGAFSGTRRYVAIATTMPTTTDLPTGDGVVYIANAVTNPSSNPVGGGVLFVSAGALNYRGPTGTVTTIALA